MRLTGIDDAIPWAIPAGQGIADELTAAILTGTHDCTKGGS